MEEQVGMMAHNEAYKQSVETAAANHSAGIDDLYQDSMVPDHGSKELIIKREEASEEPVDR